MKRSKLGALAAVAVGLMSVAAGATAANADDPVQPSVTVQWTVDCVNGSPVGTASLTVTNVPEGTWDIGIYDVAEYQPLQADKPIVYNITNGVYSFTGPVPVGDTLYYVDSNDLIVAESMVSVDACESDPVPIVATAPTQDGQNLTIPSIDGVGYVDQNSNPVAGTIQLQDGVPVTISAVQTGDRPVTGGPFGPFVWNAPVIPDPVAPIVDAHLNGLLTDDNKSAVHAVVSVVHNDAEGPLTVVVSHGNTPDWTQVFPEGQVEPLRATFLVSECGDITFTVAIEGYPASTQTYLVEDVPCPVVDDGDDDDNSGGDDGDTGGDDGSNDGSDDDNTNTDNNAGGDKGDTDTTDTTNGSTDTVDTTSDNKSSDTGVIDSGYYDTGDTVLDGSPSSMIGYAAGGLTGLLAIMLVGMGIIRSRRATASN